MKLNLYSHIGSYSKPLKINFNGELRIISDTKNNVSFDFNHSGKYNLIIEQIDEPKQGVFAKIVLIIVGIILNVISLLSLNDFDNKEYNHLHPYKLKKMYTVFLSSDTKIIINYKDSTFYSNKNKFSIPIINIECHNIVSEDTVLNSCTEVIKQRKKYLQTILFILWIISFLVMSLIVYYSFLSQSVFAMVICLVLLLYFVIAYIIALIRIDLTYKKIIVNI